MHYWEKHGWEKFDKTSLTDKEDLYSHLNLEDITDTHYTQGFKRF